MKCGGRQILCRAVGGTEARIRYDGVPPALRGSDVLGDRSPTPAPEDLRSSHPS